MTNPDIIDRESLGQAEAAQYSLNERTLRQLSALFVAIKKECADGRCSSAHQIEVLADTGQYLADVFADDNSCYASECKEATAPSALSN